MGAAAEEHGRAAQRRRTRKAIVQAAAALLGRGITPSAAEVAAEADVSRRTVYLYFPRLEQLLVDASLKAATDAEMAAALAPSPGELTGGGVEGAVERAVRAFQRLSAETEAHGRRILRLTLGAARARGGPGGRAAAAVSAPRRGYRRVEWIERALEPVRGELTPDDYERLVSALSLVMGWEALIVLRDVRDASAVEAAEVSAWAARTLVRAALGPARGGEEIEPGGS